MSSRLVTGAFPNLNEFADNEKQRDDQAKGNLMHCAWHLVVRLDTVARRHGEPLMQPVQEPDLIDGRRKISECGGLCKSAQCNCRRCRFTIVLSDQYEAAYRNEKQNTVTGKQHLKGKQHGGQFWAVGAYLTKTR